MIPAKSTLAILACFGVLFVALVWVGAAQEYSKESQLNVPEQNEQYSYERGFHERKLHKSPKMPTTHWPYKQHDGKRRSNHSKLLKLHKNLDGNNVMPDSGYTLCPTQFERVIGQEITPGFSVEVTFQVKPNFKKERFEIFLGNKGDTVMDSVLIYYNASINNGARLLSYDTNGKNKREQVVSQQGFTPGEVSTLNMSLVDTGRWVVSKNGGEPVTFEINRDLQADYVVVTGAIALHDIALKWKKSKRNTEPALKLKKLEGVADSEYPLDYQKHFSKPFFIDDVVKFTFTLLPGFQNQGFILFLGHMFITTMEKQSTLKVVDVARNGRKLAISAWLHLKYDSSTRQARIHASNGDPAVVLDVVFAENVETTVEFERLDAHNWRVICGRSSAKYQVNTNFQPVNLYATGGFIDVVNVTLELSKRDETQDAVNGSAVFFPLTYTDLPPDTTDQSAETETTTEVDDDNATITRPATTATTNATTAPTTVVESTPKATEVVTNLTTIAETTTTIRTTSQLSTTTVRNATESTTVEKISNATEFLTNFTIITEPITSVRTTGPITTNVRTTEPITTNVRTAEPTTTIKTTGENTTTIQTATAPTTTASPITIFTTTTKPIAVTTVISTAKPPTTLPKTAATTTEPTTTVSTAIVPTVTTASNPVTTSQKTTITIPVTTKTVPTTTTVSSTETTVPITTTIIRTTESIVPTTAITPTTVPITTRIISTTIPTVPTTVPITTRVISTTIPTLSTTTTVPTTVPITTRVISTIMPTFPTTTTIPTIVPITTRVISTTVSTVPTTANTTTTMSTTGGDLKPTGSPLEINENVFEYSFQREVVIKTSIIVKLRVSANFAEKGKPIRLIVGDLHDSHIYKTVLQEMQISWNGHETVYSLRTRKDGPWMPAKEFKVAQSVANKRLVISLLWSSQETVDVVVTEADGPLHLQTTCPVAPGIQNPNIIQIYGFMRTEYFDVVYPVTRVLLYPLEAMDAAFFDGVSSPASIEFKVKTKLKFPEQGGMEAVIGTIDSWGVLRSTWMHYYLESWFLTRRIKYGCSHSDKRYTEHKEKNFTHAIKAGQKFDVRYTIEKENWRVSLDNIDLLVVCTQVSSANTLQLGGDIIVSDVVIKYHTSKDWIGFVPLSEKLSPGIRIPLHLKTKAKFKGMGVAMGKWDDKSGWNSMLLRYVNFAPLPPNPNRRHIDKKNASLNTFVPNVGWGKEIQIGNHKLLTNQVFKLTIIVKSYTELEVTFDDTNPVILTVNQTLDANTIHIFGQVELTQQLSPGVNSGNEPSPGNKPSPTNPAIIKSSAHTVTPLPPTALPPQKSGNDDSNNSS